MRPSADARPIRVLFLVLPDSLALDWAGPAEALRSANALLVGSGREACFELQFVGPQAEPLTSVGVRLRDVRPLPPGPLSDELAAVWVVVVGQPGEHVDTGSALVRAALAWLRGLRLEAGRLELVSVCAGAVLAAHAGLLTDRDATTHHQHLDELRAADPRCRVVSNRVFVVDGPVCTSAGVTTGIDLMLHRIAAVCGAALAARVAQSMVVALRRGPGDPELSPFLDHRNHLHPAVHRVQDAIAQSPTRGWTVAAMAATACVSQRHLARLFRIHAGIGPLEYLQGIRLAAARAALNAGTSVTGAAELAGFSSDTQLRRAWRRAGMAGTPSTQYAVPIRTPGRRERERSGIGRRGSSRA